jgi:5-methylthioadenosine/S-adenosylhomocysteine deaminase
VVKHEGRLVGCDLGRARRAVAETVEFAQRELGDDVWASGMHPEIPEAKILENPYQYTEWDAGEAQWKR